MKHTIALILILLITACGRAPEMGDSESLTADAIGHATCAACGMVVSEQPAPRGQMIHRDRTRVFFCSLGDMVRYYEAPSPHGQPVAVYVELMDPSTSPTLLSMEPRPWAQGQETAYVLGLPRTGIMGEPIMAYATEAQADQVIRAHGGHLVEWNDLIRQEH